MPAKHRRISLIKRGWKRTAFGWTKGSTDFRGAEECDTHDRITGVATHHPPRPSCVVCCKRDATGSGICAHCDKSRLRATARSATVAADIAWAAERARWFALNPDSHL